jgi:hypothetical protein
MSTEKRTIDQETIEEYARRENEEAADKARAREEYLRNAALLAEETPQRFFEFVDALHAHVTQFNQVIDLERRLWWEESAALAVRSPNRRGDFNLTFGRKHVEIFCALNELQRLGRGPLAYVIEGTGKLGEARFRFRCEGTARREGIFYRITVDYRRVDLTLAQFAERLVLAATKDDVQQLFRK